MDAFVMKRVGETGFADKDVPEAGPMDAVIRPTKGLVCTSDGRVNFGVSCAGRRGL